MNEAIETRIHDIGNSLTDNLSLMVYKNVSAKFYKEMLESMVNISVGDQYWNGVQYMFRGSVGISASSNNCYVCINGQTIDGYDFMSRYTNGLEELKAKFEEEINEMLKTSIIPADHVSVEFTPIEKSWDRPVVDDPKVGFTFWVRAVLNLVFD